jgi:hypothetical protein
MVQINAVIMIASRIFSRVSRGAGAARKFVDELMFKMDYF